MDKMLVVGIRVAMKVAPTSSLPVFVLSIGERLVNATVNQSYAWDFFVLPSIVFVEELFILFFFSLIYICVCLCRLTVLHQVQVV